MKNIAKTFALVLVAFGISAAAQADVKPVGTVVPYLCGNYAPAQQVCLASKVGFPGTYMVIGTQTVPAVPSTAVSLTMEYTANISYKAGIFGRRAVVLPTKLTTSADYSTGKTVGQLAVLRNGVWQLAAANFDMWTVYTTASLGVGE